MMKATCRLLPVLLLFSLFITPSSAQPAGERDVIKDTRPYKLLNNGRQITIRSTKNIKHVMIWTTSGNRVVEHKEINASSFTVEIPVNQKNFFLMVGMNDGKIYTEKIGIR